MEEVHKQTNCRLSLLALNLPIYKSHLKSLFSVWVIGGSFKQKVHIKIAFVFVFDFELGNVVRILYSRNFSLGTLTYILV